MPTVASTYWSNWVRRVSTQETLFFREQVFIQTNSHGTFPWILIPVSATLANQGLLRPSPKSCSVCQRGGVKLCPRGSLQPSAVQVQFCGLLATPGGHWKKGHADKWRLPLHQDLRMNSDGAVSGGWGGKRGLGFWPEFIYLVVTLPPLLSALPP
jgi:hypothetical protein